MNSERNCYVYIVLPGSTEFVTAAQFQISQSKDGVPIGEFIYGKRYLAREDAVEIDPIELKLGPNQFETIKMQGFFGAIRDAMPDYWGRQVIDRATKKPYLDDFGYLMHGPDDRAGALGFGLNVIPPAPKRNFNRTLDLAKLQKTANLILNDKPVTHEDKSQIQALLLEGTSMGGARPKAVVEDKTGLWVAKFSSPHDRWNQPKVEHAFLKLAKLCGLTVADSKIVKIGRKDVLLVHRFDRDKTEQGYRRYRMVSALTLLKSEDNVSSRGEWSYLSLADEIRRISDKPKEDLCELFTRMCFNAIVSNLDDHPRNHAILAKNKNWRLSPAFDINPTPTIAQDKRFLAMSCGLYGRLANKDNLLSAHGRFFLTYDEANDILEQLTNTVRNKWVSCLRRVGVSQKDCTTIASAFLYNGFFYPMEAQGYTHRT